MLSLRNKLLICKGKLKSKCTEQTNIFTNNSEMQNTFYHVNTIASDWFYQAEEFTGQIRIFYMACSQHFRQDSVQS